jgi:GNAT superfamily N-acetyltransferase
MSAHRAIFASTDLAARIERAECRLLTTSAASVAQRREGLMPFVRELAGGVAVYTVPDSPHNKLIGLGFGAAVDEGELEAIERAFAERGAPLRVELSTLGEPSVGALLTRRGYVLCGFENVLGRALPATGLPEAADGVELTIAGEEDLARWLDVVVTGFMTPDTQGVASNEEFPRAVIEEVIADMAGVEGLVRWLAHRGGQPAGGGSMRIDEDRVAQLCGAATLPAHRRRGVQTSLLSARLSYAAERGCDMAVVMTLPGSKSCENVMRQGFELLFSRAVLVKDA